MRFRFLCVPWASVPARLQIMITRFAHCFPRVPDECYTMLRCLTSAATIHYQIGTPPVQQRFLPHNFTLALWGPQSLTPHLFLNTIQWHVAGVISTDYSIIISLF